MLDSSLAGVGGLLGCHAEREVSVYGNPPLVCLTHEGEIRVAGEILVNLDEVRAGVRQRVDDCPRLVRIAHDDRVVRVAGRIAIDGRAVGDQARPLEVTARESTLDRVRQREGRVATPVVHVSNAGDTVRQKQGEVPGRVGCASGP